jgi:hypothetical protein
MMDDFMLEQIESMINDMIERTGADPDDLMIVSAPDQEFAGLHEVMGIPFVMHEDAPPGIGVITKMDEKDLADFFKSVEDWIEEIPVDCPTCGHPCSTKLMTEERLIHCPFCCQIFRL